jgi:hypothetical protein
VVSESIGSSIDHAANLLIRNSDIISAFTEEFNVFLSQCKPLMRIFTLKYKEEYLNTLTEFEREESNTIINTESLSLLTMPDKVASSIMSRIGVESNSLSAYQRPPSAQWTSTAAGGMVLSANDKGDAAVTQGQDVKEIYITHATPGKIIDAGIKDVNQMGAAMAPAAVDTIVRHLMDTQRAPEFYDLILTGDLGLIGKQIAMDLLNGAGMDVANIYDDCGAMMYFESQDTHGGGSGCGCSASIFSGYVYKEMRSGKIKNALLVSTGALLSTISPQQGESIPGIAHAVAVTTEGGN